MQPTPLHTFVVAGSLLAALASGAGAQTAGTWTQQSPLPVGSDLFGVAMVSPTEGFAVGSTGVVLHTKDLGQSFDVSHLSTDSLEAVFFVDPLLGFAAGNGIFRTTDGGHSWTQTSPWGSLYDLSFVDAQHGWACGNGGLVYRTTDGGLSWTWKDLQTDFGTLSDIFFLDVSRGWACGADARLYATTDGGDTWSKIPVPTTNWLSGVAFVSPLEGWVMTGDATLHTTNGGLSWTNQPFPAGSWAFGFEVKDAQHAWAVGAGDDIVATSNGGGLWKTQMIDGGPRLWNSSFFDLQHGLAVGETGRILATSDGGTTWTPKQSGTAGYTNGLCALDHDHAWSANNAGEILSTTDGGKFWNRSEVTGFDEFGRLTDIDFADTSHGWAVGVSSSFGGDVGTIVHSNDGGKSWTVQFQSIDFWLEGVAAVDASTAVAVGYRSGSGPTIYRTTNGGATWVPYTGLGGLFLDVDFVNATIGWIIGGSILKTTDAGASWSVQAGFPYSAGAAISFADDQNGWAVGYYGTVMHTTNGGTSWTQQGAGPLADTNIISVAAVNATTAWIGATYASVARTTNGGLTWKQEKLGSNTYNSFAALAFLNEDYGWVGGSTVEPKGGILRRVPDTSLVLTTTPLLAGQSTTLRADGAAPLDTVFILFSLTGTGAGPCFFGGTFCLDVNMPFYLLTGLSPDAQGTASLSLFIPQSAPAIPVSFQAVAMDPAGANLRKSNAETLPIVH
jgi:photosystem II stability/assembly factor-like uncharacterized protein